VPGLGPRRPRHGRRRRPGRHRAGSARAAARVVPWSTTRPSARKTTSSASAMVAIREATTRTVVPAAARRRAARISCSTLGSMAEVASSRMSRLGVANDGSGERDALALPSGEVGPALTDDGVEAPRQCRYKSVGAGDAQRLPDLVVTDLQTEGDVAADSVLEEEGSAAARRRPTSARAPWRRRRRSTLSTSTTPVSGSTRRTNRPASVDLPEPVGPTIAVVPPADTSMVTPCSTGALSVAPEGFSTS
jgi:hypothetical protein